MVPMSKVTRIVMPLVGLWFLISIVSGWCGGPRGCQYGCTDGGLHRLRFFQENSGRVISKIYFIKIKRNFQGIEFFIIEIV